MKTLEICWQESVQLLDGRQLNLFVNRETNLVVVDVLEGRSFGNEFIRRSVPAPMTAADKRRLTRAIKRQEAYEAP